MLLAKHETALDLMGIGSGFHCKAWADLQIFIGGMKNCIVSAPRDKYKNVHGSTLQNSKIKEIFKQPQNPLAGELVIKSLTL